MVTIYGSSIDGGFTSGTSLVAIYTYGCQVWPSEESWTGPWPGPEVHPGDYYIIWTPTNITGTFVIDSVVYNLEDYNGYFEDFSGTITTNAFSNNYDMSTVETTAKNLSTGAFRHCTSLESADLIHCVSIGQYAFANCINLLSLSVPECTYIGSSAFSSCVMLSEVILPKVEIIGDNAFSNCWDATYLNIGSNCNTVGSNAFYSFGWSAYNRSAFITVKLGWEGEGLVEGAYISRAHNLVVPAWKVNDYYNAGWSNMYGGSGVISGYYHIRYPGFESYYYYGGTLTYSFYSATGEPLYFETDAVIADSTVLAPGGSYYVNRGMASTSIVSVSMSQLALVRDNGFKDCSDLEDLYAPKIQEIEYNGFKGCSKLPYILLPVCSSIGSHAFEGCSSLSYIMLGSNYCDISDSTFYGCTNLTAIYVKSNRVSYFKSSTYWSAYSDIIYPISEY